MSEFESPKLKIAGNLHEVEAKTKHGAKLTESDTKIATTSVFEKCDSIIMYGTQRLRENMKFL